MAHRPRVVAVIVLLIVAAAALHGYIPGAPPPPRDRPTSGSGSLFVVAAMLIVSLAIIAIAIITQARRGPMPSGPGEPRRSMTGESRPLTWRMVLIAVAVVLAWLLLVALLARLNTPTALESPPPDAGTPTPGAPQPSREPEQPQPPSNVFSLLAGATVLLMMLAFVTATIAARRQHRAATMASALDDYPPATPQGGPDPLARAAEVGLAEAGDLSREPREAIIACYAAMERELANSPDIVPRESDTPSEVLARAVEHHALRADSATQLVELFEEARFSPHVMTEAHRETALRILRLVLAELRSMA